LKGVTVRLEVPEVVIPPCETDEDGECRFTYTPRLESNVNSDTLKIIIEHPEEEVKKSYTLLVNR